MRKSIFLRSKYHYPFGMQIQSRSYSAPDKEYRFGFNGYENLKIVTRDEVMIDFGARIYDARCGRFLSTDPWEEKYAWQSPYPYFRNSPISTVDHEGKGGVDDKPNVNNPGHTGNGAGESTHTVASGDNVWKIAASKLGGEASDAQIMILTNAIIARNHLNKNGDIEVNQILTIPSISTGSNTSTSMTSHQSPTNANTSDRGVENLSFNTPSGTLGITFYGQGAIRRTSQSSDGKGRVTVPLIGFTAKAATSENGISTNLEGVGPNNSYISYAHNPHLDIRFYPFKTDDAINRSGNGTGGTYRALFTVREFKGAKVQLDFTSNQHWLATESRIGFGVRIKSGRNHGPLNSEGDLGIRVEVHPIEMLESLPAFMDRGGKDPQNPSTSRLINCFVAGTQIYTEFKKCVSIEKIRVGDSVLTFNLKQKKIEKDIVEEISISRGYDLVKISFDNNRYNVNSRNHPYYVIDKGWCSVEPPSTLSSYGVAVNRLEIGDAFWMITDEGLIETKITHLELICQPTILYNLSKVEQHHNFFANGILVHNKYFEELQKSKALHEEETTKNNNE